MLSFITCLLLMISLDICISISNGIPTLKVQISMKTDPYSALDKPQKHTLRGRTSGRSFTLSAPPGDVGRVVGMDTMEDISMKCLFLRLRLVK